MNKLPLRAVLDVRQLFEDHWGKTLILTAEPTVGVDVIFPGEIVVSCDTSQAALALIQRALLDDAKIHDSAAT